MTENLDPFQGVVGNIEVRMALDPTLRPNWEPKGQVSEVPEWMKELSASCWADNAEDRPGITRVRTALMHRGIASSRKGGVTFADEAVDRELQKRLLSDRGIKVAQLKSTPYGGATRSWRDVATSGPSSTPSALTSPTRRLMDLTPKTQENPEIPEIDVVEKEEDGDEEGTSSESSESSEEDTSSWSSEEEGESWTSEEGDSSEDSSCTSSDDKEEGREN